MRSLPRRAEHREWKQPERAGGAEPPKLSETEALDIGYQTTGFSVPIMYVLSMPLFLPLGTGMYILCHCMSDVYN